MKHIGLNERQAGMVLNGLPHLGPVSVQRLVERFGGSEGNLVPVFEQSSADLQAVRGVGPEAAAAITGWEQHFPLEREEQMLEKLGARFILARDPEYPRLLRETGNPPVGLYALGPREVRSPAVAIVGTRRPTLYGRTVARRLAEDLARIGCCIVSGMARGIDAEAHEGALDAGGSTGAVFGCGLDIVYPPEHLELYRRLSGSGVLFSEFPFGRRADRQSFPQRNRVVAGLCDAIVVVESDARGGSMITARFAGENGRMVFAVPGRVDQPASRGCHQLIRDGATLLTGVDDLVQELRYMQLDLKLGDRPEAGERDDRSLGSCSAEERRILEHLDNGEVRNPDELARESGLPLYAVSASLVMLELKRLVVKRADGAYQSR